MPFDPPFPAVQQKVNAKPAKSCLTKVDQGPPASGHERRLKLAHFRDRDQLRKTRHPARFEPLSFVVYVAVISEANHQAIGLSSECTRSLASCRGLTARPSASTVCRMKQRPRRTSG